MEKLKVAIVLLNAFRLIPHIIIYYFHPRRGLIKDDVFVNNCNKESLIIFLKSLVFNRTYRNLFYYRIGRIQWLFSWLCPRCHDLYIRPEIKIGQRAKFTHNHTTHLNTNLIGDDFECFHLVTIGNSKGGTPRIGNNVCVYTGAMILGDITIGNNVRIGAGSIVLKDVPNDATVTGNPAKIVRLKGQKVDIKL